MINQFVILSEIFSIKEILLILLIVLILFGGKKIPELMRGLGRGVKEFKEGMSGDEPKDAKKEEKENKQETEKK